jgi:hypothetical protein
MPATAASALWRGKPPRQRSKRQRPRIKKFCDTFLAKAGNDLKDQGLDVDWACADGIPARQIIAYDSHKLVAVVAYHF